MESGDSEQALDITGEDLSEGHVGTESRSLNAMVHRLLEAKM